MTAPTALTVAAMLAPLSRVRGVRGVALAQESDAIVVAHQAHVDVDVDALAAFGVSLMQRVRAGAANLERGEPHIVTVESEQGRVVAATKGGMLVIVLTDRAANAGIVRLAAQRIAQQVAS